MVLLALLLLVRPRICPATAIACAQCTVVSFGTLDLRSRSQHIHSRLCADTTPSPMPASLVRRLELRISATFSIPSAIQSRQEQPDTAEAKLIRKLAGEAAPGWYRYHSHGQVDRHHRQKTSEYMGIRAGGRFLVNILGSKGASLGSSGWE